MKVKKLYGLRVGDRLNIKGKDSLYCCECERKIQPIFITGETVYPNRNDLYHLPFWQCTTCFNFVGCHHKTTNPTNPLGSIPNKEIKEARKEIHKILDPLWKNGSFNRKKLYRIISDKIGWKYHTAQIKMIEEAREVYRIILDIKKV
jgi:hypothetical protein